MEPEGILNGSNRNERSTNTTTITGNMPAVQSSHQGCMTSCSRACATSPSTCLIPMRSSSARPLGGFLIQFCGHRKSLGQEIEALGQPVNTSNNRSHKQKQREVAVNHAEVPACAVADKRGQNESGENLHQSSTCKIARKASWGTSTEPICFMRFLPAFCFSRSFFLRE